MNMSELENICDLIRKTMAKLLSAQVYEKLAHAPKFCHQTHKTDIQKSVLTQEINEFRQEHLKKPKIVENPFSDDEDLTMHAIQLLIKMR